MFADSAQGKVEVAAQYVFFSRVQPLLFLSTGLNWTPTNAAHVRTQRIALRPPPACSLYSQTPPTPSALSIPVSQNNNPPHPFHFDNVTSTQPHQINKLAAGLVSVTHPPIIITIASLATTPRRELQLR